MQLPIEKVIEQLRVEYGHELNPSPERRRRRFSGELKKRVLSEIEFHSVSAEALGEGLGLGRSTISQWKRHLGLRQSKRTQSTQTLFKKLEVEPVHEEGVKGTHYLEARSGVRVFGLSMIQMAELLRCL